MVKLKEKEKTFVTQSEYARIRGVSRQAIHKKIKNLRIIHQTERFVAQLDFSFMCSVSKQAVNYAIKTGRLDLVKTSDGKKKIDVLSDKAQWFGYKHSKYYQVVLDPKSKP